MADYGSVIRVLAVAGNARTVNESWKEEGCAAARTRKRAQGARIDGELQSEAILVV